MSVKKAMAAAAGFLALAMAAAYFILAGYDYNALKPKVIRAVKSATGRDLALDGDIRLEIGLTPSLVVEGAALKNPGWARNPDLVRTRRFEVKAALWPLFKGEVEVRRLVIVEPEVFIETGPGGKSSLSFDVPDKDAGKETAKKEKEPSRPMSLVFNDLRIENAVVSWIGDAGGEALSIRIDHAAASAQDVNSPIRIDFKGAFEKTPFRFSAATGALKDLMDPETPWPVDIRGRAGEVDADISGDIQNPLSGSGLNLDFSLKTTDIRRIKAAADAIPSAAPFEASGKIRDRGPGKYALSGLRLALGANVLEGSASLDLSGKTPFVRTDLKSKAVDLGPFFPGEKIGKKREGKNGETGAKKEEAGPWPRTPLPFDVLKTINADIRLAVQNLKTPKMTLDDLRFHGRLQNGALDIRAFDAHIGGGPVKGRLTLTPAKKSADISGDVSMKGLDLGEMVKGMGSAGALEGKADIHIRLKTRGESAAGLVENLSGTAAATMQNGRFHSRWLRLAGTDFSTGLIKRLNPAGEKEDSAKVNCLAGAFGIQKGVARTEVLLMDTPNFSVSGEGSIDLNTRGLDMAFHPHSKEGLKIPGAGKIGVGLGDLAKTFRVKGTWSDPSLTLDPARTAVAIGKAIGGVALFGPVGAAAALLTGNSGDENPCVASLKKARGLHSEKKNGNEKPSGKPNPIRDAARGVGETLMKFLGK
ncbi:conserved hypothetical protein [Candidatus Desulfarcum epimagneticum]|uniref:AsmA domain-containing protein n=1 Tax=uncultured Desulfobacteraceae bacterium TaxID=218296 RepID=A0A484HFM2_9BACT|nr:conserved hypothetical protein [uncultured Desulfobacteraceae bacterium]